MRILIISHFGPLYVAEYIYKYLSRLRHEVYTVGRLYNKELAPFSDNVKRLGNSHLPLFYLGKQTELGMPKFVVDISDIFGFLGSEWDAIIECECYNLEVTDNHNIIHNLDYKYLFYKTEHTSNYITDFATHILYASKMLLPFIKKYISDDVKLIYLPFTVDPEIVKKDDSLFINYGLYFAGQYPTEDYLPQFKEAYKMRKETIDYLESNINSFLAVKERKYDYIDYIFHLNQCNIMLNIGIGGWNLRDFEALALGKPLITYEHPEYDEWFIDNETIKEQHVLTFKDKEGALDCYKALMNNPAIIKIMGEINYKLFMEKHHPKHRVNTILKAIKGA